MADTLKMLERESISSFLSLSLPFKKQIGRVHSVFRTSLNVAIGDQLINLSQLKMPLSAFGCLVGNKKMNELVSNCLPGDMVKAQDSTLFFYTQTGVFRLDVSHFEEIDLSLGSVCLPADSIRYTATYKCLKEASLKKYIGLEKDQDTEERFNRLKTVSVQSEEDIKKDIAFLIGRGKGLTPSGDDILSGYTMIRKTVMDNDPFEDLLKQALARWKTTDISTAYYHALFSGYVSSLFLIFVTSFGSNDTEYIKRLIETIKKYGHTSGYDTLFGMSLGLESLIHDLEE